MDHKLNLQFFARAEQEGRTETATSKKRSDVRKKGQVVKSAELNTALILLAFFIIMRILAPYYVSQCSNVFKNIMAQMRTIVVEFNKQHFLHIIRDSLINIILINGILFIVLFLVAFLASYWQVGFKVTLEPLKPKLNKFNPVNGFKKIFGIRDSLIELLKNLFKVIILGTVFYNTIISQIPSFLGFYDLTIQNIAIYVADVIRQIGTNVGLAFLVLAYGDYRWQKYKFEDSIKMTKHDVKEEFKQSEGDPAVKSKIRQKMREMSISRMMKTVPEADVIITNPTHFAVAIYYDRVKGIAPVVVAKGTDNMAQRIKEIAAISNVQIVENKPLARALYYTVDIGSAIPQELYEAVAEVLAFVYRLENRL
ncbi:flagellar biosynthesis protein FlhB [Candidatus Epulonipiscium viviparus]|uniref:flagellar biosynthesis protein FlhB n=1 Tax=Candidatus Epulonipiscium viviparus TaxID=420336 RepID=UPI00016C0EEF|nr:flagellar biosynthesis protein FlhB [Candidatus Epulopiscium viviparus]